MPLSTDFDVPVVSHVFVVASCKLLVTFTNKISKIRSFLVLNPNNQFAKGVQCLIVRQKL